MSHKIENNISQNIYNSSSPSSNTIMPIEKMLLTCNSTCSWRSYQRLWLFSQCSPLLPSVGCCRIRQRGLLKWYVFIDGNLAA